MRKAQVVMEMQFDRKDDSDLYDLYDPINLLLGSFQGKDTSAIANTLKEIGITMEKGKRYRITIEELE